MAKQETIIFIPPVIDNQMCDRCNSMGAREMVGEWLCNHCIYDDVFEEMNDRNN